MTTRIATSYQNAATLRSLQKAASDMDKSTYQVTTGYKAKTLADESSAAQQILTLRDVSSRTSNYIDNLTAAKSAVTAAETTLQNMTDLLTDANNLVTLARNANDAETRAALAPKAQSLAESFYSLLQTQYNGQYLFSGSNAQQTPISGVATATAYPGSPLSTTWYEGDTQLQSTISGAGLTLQYGVLGNDDAFAKMKAGLESLWYSLKNNDVTEMDNATSALDAAKTGLSSLLGQTGGQLNSIALLATTHTDQKSFVSNQLDDLEKVDMSEALTTYSAQQATLQASLLVISKMNQTSLLDYLK
jgi:flagellar hook-associated protein 3 FlgL